jgi:hypothetical protein
MFLSRQPPDTYSLVMRYWKKIAQARSCLLLQHSLLAACGPALPQPGGHSRQPRFAETIQPR